MSDTETGMSSSDQETALPDVLRPVATLAFSMSQIHLDEAEKNKKKDGKDNGWQPSQLKTKTRWLKRLDDEERRRRLRLAHRNNRRQGDFFGLREALGELMEYRRVVRQRVRERMREAARAAPPPQQPPASNGYTGRASIWAPGGFNPLLNVSELVGSQPPQPEDEAAP